MKKRILSLLIVCCLTVSTYFVGAGAEPSYADAAATSYTTYTMSSVTMKSAVPDVTVSGNKCTAMQGLEADERYIYTSKIYSPDDKVGSANARVIITRTDAVTGENVVMKYYASEGATTESVCTGLGHANSLSICYYGGNTYMYVQTASSGKCMARLRVDGDKLYLNGYFNLYHVDTGSNFNPGGIRFIKEEGGYFYFLIKGGMQFYYGRVPATENGGTISNPVNAAFCKVFAINTRNAVFNINGTNTTIPGIDTWTNQDFYYSYTENAIYVPIFDDVQGNRNAIIIYSGVDECMAKADFSNLTATSNPTLYPCDTNFYIEDTTQTLFEVESCAYRTGANQTDKYLYFNTNATSAAKEGVYAVAFSRDSKTFTSVADSSSVIFSVKYAGNGGSVPSGTASKYNMSTTIHIRGINAILRQNYFAKSGYTFAGWYLSRKSDSKTLYYDASGSTKWYVPGTQPAGAYVALYSDMQRVSALTSVNGDTITCTAQWTPVSTGITSYYVDFNGNGGSGSMAMQKIVYGTATGMTVNSFIKSGYDFAGWTCFRRSDNKWIFKTSTGSDSWQTYSDGIAAGYTLKVYKDGANISKTSSTDCDIITMYAQWTEAEIKDDAPTALVPADKAPMTSTSVSIDGSSEAVFIFNGTASASLAKSYFNDSDYVRIIDGAGSIAEDSVKVGTGMKVQCIVNGSIIDEKVIIVKGDTDGDGEVTVTDAALVMSHVSGSISLNGYCFAAADVCRSGYDSINILNVMAVLNLI